MNIQKVVEDLIDIFLIAGDLSLQLREKGLSKKIKSDNTPVSNGDLEVNKIIIKKLKSLKYILNEIFLDIKKKKLKKNIILFSPAGASFDNFKNFEDRGLYFNKLIKKFINAK